MSRKGFEIAISTIVVMVLGILIIGGGLVIVSKLMKTTSRTVGTLTATQEQHLQELLSAGQLVAVYPLSQTMTAGTSATVGLGIENRAARTTFSITIQGSDPQGGSVTWAHTTPDIEVPLNKRGQAVIVLAPPKNAPAGTYTFLVTVSQDGTYDAVRVFTVRVA